MLPVNDNEAAQSLFTAYFEALVTANISEPQNAIFPNTGGQYTEERIFEVQLDIEHNSGDLDYLYNAYVHGEDTDLQLRFEAVEDFKDRISKDCWNISSARSYYGTETAYAAYNQVKAGLEAPNPFPTIG